jgi:hypothetical protein
MTNHIHIPAVAPVTRHSGDGAQTLFAYSFPVFRPEDLQVFVGDQLQSTGYAVLGDGASDGGVVRFDTAPAAGRLVTLRRKPEYQRTDDLDDRLPPNAHDHNDLADAFAAAMQEVDEALSRTVSRKVTSASAADLALPEPEAGKLLGWNGSASGLVNVPAVDTSDVLLKSNNLADLPDKASARTNLGLGSAATHAATDFATAAQGAKADSAVQPGSLGTAAWLAVDTDGTLAANSDTHLPSQKAVKTYVDAHAGASVTAVRIVDTTDVALASCASGGSRIGGSFQVNVPASGLIRISVPQIRLDLPSGTVAGLGIGIEIDGNVHFTMGSYGARSWYEPFVEVSLTPLVLSGTNALHGSPWIELDVALLNCLTGPRTCYVRLGKAADASYPDPITVTGASLPTVIAVQTLSFV